MIQIVPPDFENHWLENHPDETYHSDPTSVGSGRLKVILKSPAAFRHLFQKPKQEPNDNMKFGTLVHKAILEPAKFNELLVVMPKFSGKTKDGRDSETSAEAKAAKAAWKAALKPGTIICTQEELDDISGMVTSLLNHEQAFRLLKGGKSEISGYYRDPETGIKCRIRPDFLQFDLNALVDIKTTRDCTRGEFSKTIWNYRYDFQLAMYCEGVKQITGKAPDYPAIIAIEKSPPYDVAVYLADEAMLERGALDYRKALRKLAECMKTDKWHGYQADLQTIGLPAWAFFEE